MTAARGVAWAALAALLDAEVDAATALETVASHVPPPFAARLRTAAARVRDGADPAAALADAEPDLAPLLENAAADLPHRLRLFAESDLRGWRLNRRIHAVVAYPLLVTLATVVVTVGLSAAVLARQESALLAMRGQMAVYVSWALVAASLALLAHTAWTLRAGRAPGWLAAFPGGAVFHQAAQASAVARYALLRTRALGERSPETALALATADVPMPTDVAAELRIGEAADRPAETATVLADHLEREAAASAERLLASVGAALLVVAAIGVAAFVVLVYGGMFDIVASVW